MKTYTAYFRADAEFVSFDFDAETPEQALALARETYEDEPSELWFAPDGGMDVNEILVYDANGKAVAAVWYDDKICLRGAARDLLDALEAMIDRDDAESVFATPVLNQARAAVAKAKGGAA
jgi:hypothetical protein